MSGAIIIVADVDGEKKTLLAEPLRAPLFRRERFNCRSASPSSSQKRERDKKGEPKRKGRQPTRESKLPSEH